ncbi:hypothetical protein GCM10010404_74520 [Nonomuraea africana]|uniref:Dihydrofolate reductase n=1 Tax=Nonomuraea africana TaxID=46171 RepID=A0ABR9KDH3_9ACTN|nr:hypothetical protein [Nonomuraea africana]MBE1559856.1 hypothetical protein [Nonomuraea africana]
MSRTRPLLRPVRESHHGTGETTRRSVIHWIHTSIDGYICDPQGEFDWPEMGKDSPRR